MVKHTDQILLLSSWYPSRLHPYLGNFVQFQAKILAQRFKVTVLHTVAVPETSITEISDTVTGNLREIIIYHPKGTHLFSRRRALDKAFDTGLQMIDHVDLIHAHVVLPKGYLFARAKKRFNCPLVLTEHGSYFRPDKRKKWTLKDKFILSVSTKYIDLLIAVSPFLKKDMQKFYKDMKIEVLGNPIDTELFRPGGNQESDKIRFLHISTLDPSIKNPEGIINAVAYLKEKGYHKFEMVFVSDEPYEHLEKIVEEKALRNMIRFYGPEKHQDLPPFYRAAHAFVLFSIYETFSIVLAEAWSCGIPVISTPVGIAYELPEHLGLSVEPNDVLGLAMAMEKILLEKTFDAIEIRKHAQQYSSDRFLASISNLYGQLHG